MSNVALPAGKPCFSGLRIASWTFLARSVRHLSVLMWSRGGPLSLGGLWCIPGEPLRVLVASQGGPWMFPLGSLGDPGDVWEVLGASQVVVGSPCGVAGWSLDIPSSRKMPKSSTEPKCFSQCRKSMLFRSHDSSMDGLGRV